MKFFDGCVFVGFSDSPDDREVHWAEGHLPKFEVAKHLGVHESEVRHVFAEITEEDGTPDIAFWATEESEDFPDPVTLVFK